MTTQPLLGSEDYEDLILERLVACGKEIAGIAMVYKHPPSEAASFEQTPFIYHMLGEQGSVPIPLSGVRYVDIMRVFEQRIGIAPYDSGQDVDDLGAMAVTMTAPYMARARYYYMNRPRFKTQTLPDLEIVRGVSLGMTGPISFPAPGGATYIGIDLSFQIIFRAFMGRGK